MPGCGLALATGRVILTWAAHQPHLYPCSRTMQQLCVLHSDVLQVVDALERVETVLQVRSNPFSLQPTAFREPHARRSREHTRPFGCQESSLGFSAKDPL